MLFLLAVRYHHKTICISNLNCMLPDIKTAFLRKGLLMCMYSFSSSTILLMLEIKFIVRMQNT